MTENHADKLPPSAKPFAKFVDDVLVNDTPNYVFRKSAIACAKSVIFATIKIKFFLAAKVGRIPDFRVEIFKELVSTEQ